MHLSSHKIPDPGISKSKYKRISQGPGVCSGYVWNFLPSTLRKLYHEGSDLWLQQKLHFFGWELFKNHLQVNVGHFGSGCLGILGTTWEPDECLPPHFDDIRLREKRAWIKRKKDAGAQVAMEAGKRSTKHKSESNVATYWETKPNECTWYSLITDFWRKDRQEGWRYCCGSSKPISMYTIMHHIQYSVLVWLASSTWCQVANMIYVYTVLIQIRNHEVQCLKYECIQRFELRLRLFICLQSLSTSTKSGIPILLRLPGSWDVLSPVPPEVSWKPSQHPSTLKKKGAVRCFRLQVQKGGSRKRTRLDCHSAIPIAKHRRDGRPLERDVFCWRVGHDFQPEKMEERQFIDSLAVWWCEYEVRYNISWVVKCCKRGLGMEHHIKSKEK